MNPPFDMASLPTGEAMRLSPLVARVLAPNPSPFTYTGTQSYVVGREDVAVIDPGPAEDAHLDALIAAVGGRPVRAIVCTHTHRDHSPAAVLLAERMKAPIIGCAPLMLEDDGPRADAAFDAGYQPDDAMTDGALIAGDGWTIEAVATPGHTSNHLCYALREEGALFTGDHVMGWSTSIVSPPDGDMAEYMRSMQKLLERDDAVYYPAHGEAVESPQRLVRGMMGHRKHREGQILRQLGKGDEAGRSIADMVPEMYKGTDVRLHPAAARSVLAHLLDLEQRGLAHHISADVWRVAPR
ncbi:MBL fold metallo-hydrolase [Sphingobium sp. DEHP117]|uniref:MBL fold metallo-hydrolase n=1 Tax=Sphingobium sp. DEHP117 TaxID=2993436 RepID=UPI0027D52F91|nr:MBL fold metallo-hydrolase [Sphingobium sp. DEHP117]MDQ4421288.1 MBL fold metallo-hydrolase [Sphingobium sp. DEHP117]